MEPFERLDEAMNRRRLELRLNWREAADAAEISYTALRAIRRGEYRPAELTAQDLDRAFQWMPGSVYTILDGGDPTPAEASGAKQAPQKGQEQETQAQSAISPSEAFRRVVRSSAREFGLTPDELDQAVRLVREDLKEAPPPVGAVVGSSRGVPYRATGRTDLSDVVREARQESGLTLEDVAARAVDPQSGTHVVDADWLDRLERAALSPDEYPEYQQLDALIPVLGLDVAEVQAAAGAQFFGLVTVWSDDGQVAGTLMQEHASPESLEKARALMRRFSPAPRRPDRK